MGAKPTALTNFKINQNARTSKKDLHLQWDARNGQTSDAMHQIIRRKLRYNVTICQRQNKPIDMKKVSAQLTKRIEEINELVRRANELELMAYTYGGGTFPHIVNIKPIVIKNQFVTIETASMSQYDFIGKSRFNVTKNDSWDDNGIVALKESLTYIKRALVNAIKNN